MARNVDQTLIKDQGVWAYCLKAGRYLEGDLRVGDVFRVGYVNGEQIPTIPYPAVRMATLAAHNAAERTVAPREGASPLLAVSSEATMLRRQALEEGIDAVHSSTTTISDENQSPENPSEHRPKLSRSRSSTNSEAKGS